MTSRVLRVPLGDGWPATIELREHGGPVARWADGHEELFLLESDLLARFGWAWAELRAWAQAEDDSEEMLAWGSA